MTQFHIDLQLETLKKASEVHPENSWLPFAVGYRLIGEEKYWEGEYYLLQAAQRGSHCAAAFLAYHKLGLAELEERLKSCSSATEAQSLLHRQTPLQFIEIVSSRSALQSALQDLVVWAKAESPLACAIDALQRAVAGDRSARETLKELTQKGQPQARVWLFLLSFQDASGIDEACEWLAPFLDEDWAQRWIGSAFLQKNEPQAVSWLWKAASSGDSAAHQLLVNELRTEEEWSELHYQALAELMQHKSSEAFQLAAHLNKGVFSKLHIRYLREANALGLDTEIEIRHAQSKVVGMLLFTVAASVICVLEPALPNLSAIVPLVFTVIWFLRDQRSDSEFLKRFDGIELRSKAVQTPDLIKRGQYAHIEDALFNGDDEAWRKGFEGLLTIQATAADMSAWDLDLVSKWHELWMNPIHVPWHQIWLDVEGETCILALSGAPREIKEMALAELSTSNRKKHIRIINRVGYIPLRLCRDAIMAIQNIRAKETLSSS